MDTQRSASSIALDPTFGSGGMVRFQMPGVDYRPQMTRGPSNSILAVGKSSKDPTAITLVRFNRDGGLDLHFGVAGVMVCELFEDDGFSVDECVTLTDSRMVVAGTRLEPGSSVIRFYLACLLPDGSLDAGFADGGLRVFSLHEANNAVRGLMLQSDGHILAVLDGYHPEMHLPLTALLRVNDKGQPDPGFGDDGVVRLQNYFTFNCCLVQPDGRILLGGVNDGFGFLVRHMPMGEPDLSFGNQGQLLLPLWYLFATNVRRIALQTDGRIMVLGDGKHYGGSRFGILTRLNPDGSLDESFFGEQAIELGEVTPQDLHVDSQDRSHSLEHDNPGLAVRRFLPDGTEDGRGLLLDGMEHPVANRRAQLMPHLPGTLLVSAVVRDPDTALVIARLLL
ncbi:hypothetical protein ACX3YG_17550 [Pseudomonas wadenswilerensis]